MTNIEARNTPQMMMDLKERFDTAVTFLQELPKDSILQPTNDEKLCFYAAYKQATVGDCNIPKPAFWDIIAKAKWEEWQKLRMLSKEEAMELYVKTMVKFLKRFPDRPQAMEMAESMKLDLEEEPSETHSIQIDTKLPGPSSSRAATPGDWRTGTENESQLYENQSVGTSEQSPRHSYPFLNQPVVRPDLKTFIQTVGANSYLERTQSDIANQPSVLSMDYSLLKTMESQLGNLSYRMEKLESRVNKLSEDVKQIILDNRKSFLPMKHRKSFFMFLLILLLTSLYVRRQKDRPFMIPTAFAKLLK